MNEDEDDDEEKRRQSDDDFIDDSFQEQNPCDYRSKNMKRVLQEALQGQSMGKDLSVCTDPENFVPDCFDGVEYDFDEFAGFEKRIKNFVGELKIFKIDSKESFYYSIFYEKLFKLDEYKSGFLEDQKVIENVPGEDILKELQMNRGGFYLDLNLPIFERQCPKINNLLMDKNLPLRAYK